MLIRNDTIQFCVARLVYQIDGRKSMKTLNLTITLCENDTPQIEQYPSVRTIGPGEGCREHQKKQKCRCGNGSVAAAFLWKDTEKTLKSRAFGQKEKAGNSIKITYLLWRRRWDSTSAAAEAASGCSMPPACCQEPSGSNPFHNRKHDRYPKGHLPYF